MPKLPVARPALADALTTLDLTRNKDREVRLRVVLLDGAVVDGYLVSISSSHLSLRLTSAEARYIPADQIRAVHLATRRVVRELLPISFIVLATTGVVVALAQIDFLRPNLPSIVGGLVLVEFAALVALMRRTPLGSWLTAWKTLYDDRGP